MVAESIKQNRRKFRVRQKLKKAPNNRLRLSVHRSSKNIYAQVIDDEKGTTIVSASSLEKSLKDKLESTSNISAATEVGKLVADRAKKAGVETVTFDRGPFLYHGRIKALAEAAREGGLKF